MQIPNNANRWCCIFVLLKTIFEMSAIYELWNPARTVTEIVSTITCERHVVFSRPHFPQSAVSANMFHQLQQSGHPSFWCCPRNWSQLVNLAEFRSLSWYGQTFAIIDQWSTILGSCKKKYVHLITAFNQCICSPYAIVHGSRCICPPSWEKPDSIDRGALRLLCSFHPTTISYLLTRSLSRPDTWTKTSKFRLCTKFKLRIQVIYMLLNKFVEQCD